MAMALWGCGKDETPGKVTPPSPTPGEMNPSNEKTYTNPLFTEFSVPDPDVIRGDDGYFYMYSTERVLGRQRHVKETSRAK